jgi:hypothetical protein
MSRRIIQRSLAVLALAWALLLWAPAQSEAAGFAGSNWQVGSLWEQALSWWQGLWAQPAAETRPPASREKSTGIPTSSTSTGDVTVEEETLFGTLRGERGGAMDPNG